MAENTEWRDESIRGRHVKSSDDPPTQDDWELFHVADDMSPVAKSQDSPVDAADSSSASEKHHFCPNCGAEAVTGALFCGECGHWLIERTDAAEFDSQQTEIDLGTGAEPDSKQSDHQEAPPPTKKRRNRLILVAIIMVLILSGGIVAAAMHSGSNNSSLHSGTGTTTTTAQVNTKTDALKAFLLDNQACSYLARDMQQGTSGRIDYAEATSFSTEADTASKDSSTAASLANVATTFLRQFQDSSAGPDNVNLYPTAAVVSGCAAFKVTVPLIPNG